MYLQNNSRLHTACQNLYLNLETISSVCSCIYIIQYSMLSDEDDVTQVFFKYFIYIMYIYC